MKYSALILISLISASVFASPGNHKVPRRRLKGTNAPTTANKAPKGTNAPTTASKAPKGTNAPTTASKAPKQSSTSSPPTASSPPSVSSPPTNATDVGAVPLMQADRGNDSMGRQYATAAGSLIIAAVYNTL